MRRVLVVALAVGLLTSFGPVALAHPPASSGVVERADGFGGFIYWSDGVLAITGNELAEPCLDLPPPIVDAMLISPGDGSFQEQLSGRVPVMVFEDPRLVASDVNIGFDYIFGEQCSALLDGDPNTHPADPVATGVVELRAKSRVDKKGIVNNHNSLVGQVTTSDGSRAHLSTFAQLTIDAATGALIDLKKLSVHYTG